MSTLGASRDHVCTSAGEEEIAAVPAVQRVSPGSTVEHVRLGAADELVGAPAAVDGVAPVAAVEPVVGASTPQLVRPGEPDQEHGRIGTRNRSAAGRSHGIGARRPTDLRERAGTG